MARMTIPLVVLLGLILFGLIKWAKHKVSGIIVGILFGLALATTRVGPAILHTITGLVAGLFGAINGAVR